MFNNLSPNTTFGQNDQPEHNNIGENNTEYLNLEHTTRLGFPIRLQTGEATLDDIATHAYLRQRLQQSTIKTRLRAIRRMENHCIPVDIYQPSFDEWLHHADYREQIEEVHPAVIRNEWQAITMVLEAYGIPYGKGTQWNYKPPSMPNHKVQRIPLPDTVRDMIHHKYTDSKELNRHLQYLLLHTFMLGLRNPSETVMLKTSDVDIEKGTIVITEPKKNYSTREIAPETHFMTGNNCKSMKHWIDDIRPRYTTQHSGDSLYITLHGKPFTKAYLRKYLNDHVKPYFPEYHPYISRHWSATALLIQEYLRSKGHWNTNRVMNWLGHDNEDTTNSYIGQAETYLRLAPYNWYRRVLRHPRKNGGKYARTKTGQNRRTGVFAVCDSDLLPLEISGSAGI